MMSHVLPADMNSSSSGWRVWPLGLGIALFVVGAASSAQAQSTGIAACDDFLTKYDACITSKLPAAQRATYQAQLDQTRKAWIELVKNPATKATAEATCKQTVDALKTALQGFGCTF